MKKKKGCSIQRKQKLHIKKTVNRKKSVNSGGTISMSGMGHTKKELTESQKAFFGRQ